MRSSGNSGTAVPQSLKYRQYDRPQQPAVLPVAPAHDSCADAHALQQRFHQQRILAQNLHVKSQHLSLDNCKCTLLRKVR